MWVEHGHISGVYKCSFLAFVEECCWVCTGGMTSLPEIDSSAQNLHIVITVSNTVTQNDPCYSSVSVMGQGTVTDGGSAVYPATLWPPRLHVSRAGPLLPPVWPWVPVQRYHHPRWRGSSQYHVSLPGVCLSWRPSHLHAQDLCASHLYSPCHLWLLPWLWRWGLQFQLMNRCKIHVYNGMECTGLPQHCPDPCGIVFKACYFEGREITDGMVFSHPGKPCQECHCLAGSVKCQPLQVRDIFRESEFSSVRHMAGKHTWANYFRTLKISWNCSKKIKKKIHKLIVSAPSC